MPLRRVIPAFLGLVLISAAGHLVRGDVNEKKHSQLSSVLNEAEFGRHVGYLASDELEGRGTGQQGIDKAGEYITSQFKKWGIKPGGDDGTYYQNFKLKIRSAIGDATKFAVSLKGRPTRRAATLGEDYTPLPFSSNGSFKGEVVFAGYGILNEDLKYNDFADIDLTDKVAIVLRRGPKFADFGMRDSSFRAKASRVAARDAKALIIVNPDGDDEGDKLFDFDSGSGQRFGGGGYGIPMLQIKRSLADRMLKSAGLPDVSTLQKKIEETKKPASAELKGVNVRGTVEIEPVESPVRNIIGMIPGSGPQKNEYIILGARYDHLGIRNKGSKDFNPAKDISNGADDNGSGTTGVMMLAKAFAEGTPPNRTILFMLFTGEEMGLLGSAHYAKEPTIDLTKAIAMFNFDMIGRLKDNKLEVGGLRTGDFTESVERLAKPYQLTIKDGGGGRGPSDHTSFYNKDIPVLFFFTGLHKQYHQPEDDVPLLNLEGAIRVLQFGADIVDEIDSRSERPVFKKDTRPARIANQDQDDNAVAAGPGQADSGRPRGRGRIGITPGEPDDKPGLPVAEVREGSPAEKAGLLADDRLMAINEQKIKNRMDVFDAMRDLKPGQPAKIQIQRGEKKMTLQLQLADAGAQTPSPAGQQKTSALRSRIAGLVDSMKRIDPAAEFTVTIQDNNLSFSVTVQPGSDSEGLLTNVIDRLEPLISDQFQVNVYWTMDKKAAPAPPPRPRQSEPLRGPQPPKQAAAEKQQKDKTNPHAGIADDSNEIAAPPMPPVRLGIMPTYGESDGKGYEISGVVKGGPADKAGMKDSDRILRIGKAKVTDVYSYMEALRNYKPGDEVEVIVLREGQEKVLKVKSSAQKSPEAS